MATATKKAAPKRGAAKKTTAKRGPNKATKATPQPATRALLSDAKRSTFETKIEKAEAKRRDLEAKAKAATDDLAKTIDEAQKAGFSTNKAAEILGVSRQMVYKLVRERVPGSKKATKRAATNGGSKSTKTPAQKKRAANVKAANKANAKTAAKKAPAKPAAKKTTTAKSGTAKKSPFGKRGAKK